VRSPSYLDEFSITKVPEPPLFRSRYAMVEFMANQEHVDALLSDVDDWNGWRSDDPAFRPDLSGADLRAANLAVADLRHANLRGADLTLANLKGADLRWADMRAANLVGAQLIGADLLGADLSGTDLRTAEDLTLEQLEETTGDDRTQLPEYLQRPVRWTVEFNAR
jgi:hypothetical protein